MNKLDSALAHARAGWPVFPTHNVDGGRCSCGKVCPSPGKHPRTVNGLKDATTDESRIRKWWRRWPDANIAGRCDGLAVFDVDVRDGKRGAETLAALEADHGKLKRALVQRTGSGGLHVVFAARDGASYRGKAGKHVEIKSGDGGYIILPGSDHESGGVYAWEIGDGSRKRLPLAPEWIERSAPSVERETGDAPERYFRDDDELAEAMASLPNDSTFDDRADWLNVLAAIEFESNGSERGREIALEWSEQHDSHDPAKFDAAWRSLDWRKHPAPITGMFLADHAMRQGWSPFDDLGPLDSVKGERPDGSKLSFYSAGEFDSLKPKFDFVRGLLFDNSVGLIYAKPNAGKTFLALHLVCTVALGRPVFRLEADRRRGLFVALEGESAFKSRLKAWMRRNGVAEQPIHYALGQFDILDRKQLRALIAHAQQIGAEFVVIDTITQAAAGVAANEQKEMSAVIGALHAIKRATGACVIGLTHPSKSGGTGPAGSFVQGANADTVIQIEVIGDPESPTHTDQRVVHARKQRDGVNGAKFYFSLAEVETPDLDARGNRIISVALAESETFENLDAGEPDDGLTERARAAFALARELAEVAELCGGRAREADWRAAFYSSLAGVSAEGRKKAFVRVRRELYDMVRTAGGEITII